MSTEWEYEEANDQEKLQIAQHFLVSTPPGQVHDVMRDLKKLVPSHVLTESVLRGAMHAFNLRNTLPVLVPESNYQILICEESEIDPAHYVDTKGRRVLGFDHIKQLLIPGEETPLPDSFMTSFENERASVERVLDGYIQNEYSNQGAVAVFVKGTKLIIRICVERINLRNFWSGQWQSKWEVDIASNPVKLMGTIKLHVHYFENGNLQLQEEKNIESKDIQYSSPQALGDMIYQAIKEEEDLLQSNLEDMYINMSQETFKEMRRVMPVTQTKMEWSLHMHRAAKDLMTTKKN